ncbi:DUF6624 domain-containing protein [Chryseobacterium vrystaatense]|uniref:Uncharacterized protein n=1 Tax=Chryseobacterium vrystaatense TaxID=307480 RepID=A0A1M4WT37_9FLAO|nr:DUF6624 domain-containing protein [Chryseobacterium vrystaatense]SHE84406.1 hypothetical protein SAMN02787073_1244 [Chryseobacterium vrystaatense]
MRYLFFVIFFSVLINAQKNQDKKINLKLKNELATIQKDDQIYRELMQSDASQEQKEKVMKEKNLSKEDVTDRLWALMDEQDKINLEKVEKIIAEYGYPGKSLVGEPENETAWFVIQHSPKINQYMPVIKTAADRKEIPFRLYAMMLDRQLMDAGKEQIYGTQGFSSHDGEKESEPIIWPIKDVKNVNKLRKEAGFYDTVESYAKRLYGKSFVFKNYTLDEVLKFGDVQKTDVKPLNLELKKELAQIYKDDQIYRELTQPNITPERKAEIIKEKNLSTEDVSTGLIKLMDDQDQKNLVKVEKIIEKYGYPGKSLVGEPENYAVWYVIQHSPKIEKYFPLIKKAADEKELPFRLYAMMLDRKLMYENKEQIYGTQIRSVFRTKNGKTETLSFVWPLKDPDNVNELRKNSGFGRTIEDYAKDAAGIEYKKYTLKEALELLQKKE